MEERIKIGETELLLDKIYEIEEYPQVVEEIRRSWKLRFMDKEPRCEDSKYSQGDYWAYILIILDHKSFRITKKEPNFNELKYYFLKEYFYKDLFSELKRFTNVKALLNEKIVFFKRIITPKDIEMFIETENFILATQGENGLGFYPNKVLLRKKMKEKGKEKIKIGETEIIVDQVYEIEEYPQVVEEIRKNWKLFHMDKDPYGEDSKYSQGDYCAYIWILRDNKIFQITKSEPTFYELKHYFYNKSFYKFLFSELKKLTNIQVLLNEKVKFFKRIANFIDTEIFIETENFILEIQGIEALQFYPDKVLLKKKEEKC